MLAVSASFFLKFQVFVVWLGSGNQTTCYGLGKDPGSGENRPFQEGSQGRVKAINTSQSQHRRAGLSTHYYTSEPQLYFLISASKHVLAC